MELPILDFDQALARAGGDLDLAQTTLAKFRNQLPTDYQMPLRDAWERKDTLHLRQLSHKLRTPATLLGAQRISAAAAAMEQYMIQQDEMPIKLYEALTQAIDEFLAAF
jgi:HPt (histidine-containing phosphotransfer) domain-containing protein